MKSLLALALVAGLSCATAPAAHAAVPMNLAPAPVATLNSGIILAADGCGPGWYRGPGGACHAYGSGPYPNGYYGYYAPQYSYYGYNTYSGCPAGYWRGPWGNCRNTPYHGRLPNGGWQ